MLSNVILIMLVYHNVQIYLFLPVHGHLSIVICVCMRTNIKSIIRYQTTESQSRLEYKRHTHSQHWTNKQNRNVHPEQ